MKKSKIVCGVLASALAFSVTLGGCSSLVSANNVEDMKQNIASVNISKADDFENEGLTEYKDAVGTTYITKRELISYFLNVGYSYLNSNNNDYEATFNQLVSNLVNSAVVTQYSVMYLLKDKAKDSSASAVMGEYNALSTLADKYEYVLGGADSVDVKIAEYSLMAAINNSIDSYEERILEDEEESESGSDTRTTPTGVDSEKEKFFPKKKNSDGKYLKPDGVTVTDNADEAGIDYGIYTGYAGYELTKSGVYQDDVLKGSTPSTRKRAYNDFLASVNSYNLIDIKKENMKDVRSLRYIEDEYVNQLEQRIINKYFEVYENTLEGYLKDDASDAEKFTYLTDVYNKTLQSQKDTYKADGFTSTLDSMSDTSFVLYAPEAESAEGVKGVYGFVYNILLPFGSVQSAKLDEYKTTYADTEEASGYKQEYFIKRNALLKEIVTTDQRAAWFNGSTEYAFDAKEKGLDYYKKDDGASGWLFFENNLVDNEKYEELDKYAGKYSYNGTVVKKDDGYVLIPKKLDIDQMLAEFSAYIDYVLGNTGNVTFKNGYTPSAGNDAYYEVKNFYTTAHDTDEKDTKLDYGKFIYAEGSVSGVQEATLAATHAKLYDKTSVQYKALSAVNELQYAYTTDTGILSKYVGYSVDADETSYIKEFEYAAQKAIKEGGAGAFSVCAGDYGWHLIYVTYTLGAKDETQFVPDWTKIEADEDSFEKLFYEWVKSKNISDISNTRQNEILKQFNIDKTVKKYQQAYQDLLDLGN